MPASIFTNNDKPISRREDEGKVGFTPSISPNQRETLTLQQVLRNCRVRPGKRMDEIFVAQEPTFVDFSCRTDFHWGLHTCNVAQLWYAIQYEDNGRILGCRAPHVDEKARVNHIP